MNESDFRLGIINVAALAMSYSNLESWFKVVLLGVTIGYTITKWVMLFYKKNEPIEDK
jgi:proteasome assembly chaperone (PAC2) family protein